MHVRRGLALAAVVPLFLAGCGGSGTTDDPTPSAPAPTTSAAPTETPTEAATPEQESAEEFIRRWVDVNTAMQNSGDGTAYVELSRRCAPCVDTAERVESIYAAGGYVKTEGWHVRKIVERPTEDSGPVLDLTIRSSPTELKESTDAAVQRLAGGNIVVRVRLSSSAPWQVIGLTQIAS